MTTIAELVIAASVEPSGVQRGFDQALGYSKRFAQEADVIFKNVGMGEDNVTKARLILRRIEDQFLITNNTLKEQFLRGALDPQRFASEARQAGVAMNQALLAALEGFRSKGIFDLEAENIFISKLRTDMAQVQAQTRGTGGALSYLGGQAKRGNLGLSEIREGLTSLLAQMTGSIPVLARVGSTMTTFAAGGAISLSVVAGLAAIGLAYRKLTEDSRNAAEQQKKDLESIRSELDKTRQHISERALMAANANVEEIQRKIQGIQAESANLNNQALGGGPRTAMLSTAFVDQAKQKADLQNANRELEGALRYRDRLRREENMNAERYQDDQLTTLVKHNNATALERKLALDRLKNYQTELAGLTQTQADNERRVFLLNQIDTLKDTLQPKEKPFRDKEPFAELKAHVTDLATAYRDLREQGIGPTITLQNEAEEQFQQLGRMIANLPDQTGRAARSLLEMQRQLLTSGIHANDALLSPQFQIGPVVGNEDKTAADLAKRASMLRDAIGPLSDVALAALTAEQRFLQVVDRRIELAGGAAHASDDLLQARINLLRDLADAQKDVGGSLLSADEKEGIRESVLDLKDFLGGTRRLADGWNDVRSAIQGALDVLDAFGGMTPEIRQMANGALHLASAIKQIQKDREDRNRGGRDSVPGDGAASASAIGKEGGALSGIFGLVGSVGQYMGAIGAGISMISGVIGLFQNHDLTLQENNDRLKELREAMIDTKGIGGMEDVKNLIATLQANSEFQQNVRMANAGLGQTSLTARSKAHDMLEDAVRRAGLTMDQFNKIMEERGIAPEKTFAWLDQFGEALRIATEAATKYTSSLDDQRSLLDLHNKVFGTTTPQDQIAGTIKILDAIAPSLGHMLDGINTTTAEGREELRTALKNFVTMIESGVITPAMLGGLQGVKEFAEIISALSDSLDTLATTTDKASASMTNVPSWYKINETRWRVADPISQMPRGIGPTTPTDTKPFNPVTPVSVDSSPVQFTGPITINTRAMDGEELYRTFMRVAQEKSAARFGTSTRWSELQS